MLPLTAQRLLAFLALNEQPVRRIHVAGALWLDSSEAHSNGCLRSTLWRLHRPGLTLVDTPEDQLCLSGNIRVDVQEIAALARRLISGYQAEMSPTDLDCLISSGELLPGWYEDWVLIERERLRHIRLHALEIACEQLTKVKKYAQAVAAGLAAIDVEPLRESAYRLLILVHLAQDNRAEALREFDRYAATLMRHLRLQPSDSISSLVAHLRR